MLHRPLFASFLKMSYYQTQLDIPTYATLAGDSNTLEDLKRIDPWTEKQILIALPKFFHATHTDKQSDRVLMDIDSQKLEVVDAVKEAGLLDEFGTNLRPAFVNGLSPGPIDRACKDIIRILVEKDHKKLVDDFALCGQNPSSTSLLELGSYRSR